MTQQAERTILLNIIGICQQNIISNKHVSEMLFLLVQKKLEDFLSDAIIYWVSFAFDFDGSLKVDELIQLFSQGISIDFLFYIKAIKDFLSFSEILF